MVLIICRIPVMPFSIGLYLPIKLNATIFIGGMLRLLMDRRYPAVSNPGVLLSAGLIAGEGICGIALAVVTVMFK